MKHIFSLVLLSLISFSPLHASCPTNQQLFENKNILIIGGTGYLGRAVTSELLQYNPKSITIFSRDEVKHFMVLSKTFHSNPILKSVLGDIRDYESVFAATQGIDVVFHVAALKRMDALETNVHEAIKTDILGSINVFNACVVNNVPRVIFISTDKACSPINTYGACKFVSEKIFTNYDTSKIKTKFMATRFGNILDSTGSVIPIFIDKIQNDQDIPLTDDRMTRFIIDKADAVNLIFDALRYGEGGEIFVRKLPSMKITDLIEILKARLHGSNTVKVIGLRPGEKIHEVLINETEIPRTVEYKGYFIIQPSVKYADRSQATYMNGCSHARSHFNKEYSSEEALLSKENVENLLVRLNLL